MTREEQRIKNVAHRLRQAHAPAFDDPDEGVVIIQLHDAEAFARTLLEAADDPPPRWPADESVRKLKGAYRASCNQDIPFNDDWIRDCLREAMVADPIIKAAREARDCMARRGGDWHQKLKDVSGAVDEAGL